MFKEKIMWGDAIAANQCEGAWNTNGKGSCTMDLFASAGIGTQREFIRTVKEGKHYPSHTAIDFYHHYKEGIALLRKLVLNVCAPASIGHEFFRRVMKPSQTRQG